MRTKRVIKGDSLPYEEAYGLWLRRSVEYRRDIADLLPGLQAKILGRERGAAPGEPVFLDDVSKAWGPHSDFEAQELNLTCILLGVRTDWPVDACVVNMGSGYTPISLKLSRRQRTFQRG